MTAAPRSPAWPRIVLIVAAIASVVMLIRGFSRISGDRFGDFPAFYWAAHAMAAGEDIYAADQRGYIYPPLLAFLFRPFTWLSLSNAATVWLPLNFALLIGCTIAAARESIRRFGPVPVERAVLVVAAIALMLTADKVQATLKQGQTDGLLLLGFVLGLQWLERRPAVAGLALGFAANIKYLSLLALPYLLIRRRWAAAAWMVVGTVGWALLPAFTLGWSENLVALEQAGAGLLRSVGVEASHGVANVKDIDWLLSISITSMVSRVLGDEASMALKAGVTLAIGTATLGAVWAIFAARGRRFVWPPKPVRRDGSGDRVVALEWAGLIVAPLAFGPQTTARHMLLLIVLHAMAMAVLLGPGSARRKAPLIVGTVVLQLGLLLPPTPMYEELRNQWRYIAGASWCMLVMYLSLLWVGLPEPESSTLPQPIPGTGIKPAEP